MRQLGGLLYYLFALLLLFLPFIVSSRWIPRGNKYPALQNPQTCDTQLRLRRSRNLNTVDHSLCARMALAQPYPPTNNSLTSFTEGFKRSIPLSSEVTSNKTPIDSQGFEPAGTVRAVRH